MDTAGEGAVEQNEAIQHSDLNLSDVLRVLDADGTLEAQALPAEPSMARPQRPEVRIVEQPAPKALRFRYECEGRSAGSILGVNSTPDRKTYPTIEILGYTGRAVVLVCCVTANETPPRSHPHNLVGTECRDGVLRIKHDVTPDNRTISFTKLGVQCVKRKEVVEALNQRKRDKIDPFRAGFEHLKSPQSINLNAVRLCFQVLMPDDKGLFRHSIVVASDVVYDKKAMSELHIARVSACTGSAKGGLQMIMLCDKVSRDEISVVFEERCGERTVWRANAAVDHVHKQYAIVFTVPAYQKPAITSEVDTYLFLERQSDRACSNMIKFTYLPDVTYSDYLNGKKRKMLDRASIESYDHDRAAAAFVAEAQVKQEPRDVGRSPGQKMSPHYQDFRVNQQQWGLGEAAAGHQFLYQPQLGLQQVGLELQSLSMDPRSPNMQAASPLMQVPAHSPHMQSPSPHYQSPSPHMHVTSPHMHYQAPSPIMQAPSPNMQAPSPHMHMLPTSPADHTLITAGVMQQSQMQQQQLQQQQMQHQQLQPLQPLQLPQVPTGPPVSLDTIPSADISLTSLLGFLGADADMPDGHQ